MAVKIPQQKNSLLHRQEGQPRLHALNSFLPEGISFDSKQEAGRLWHLARTIPSLKSLKSSEGHVDAFATGETFFKV